MPYIDVNRRLSLLASPTLLLDEDAVLNAVENILGTDKGEREFLPEFGSRLSGFLFDPIDDDTASKIRYSLILAIRDWEPRVEVDQLHTRVVPNLELAGYEVSLAVRIKGIAVTTPYRIFLRSYFGDNQS